MDLDIKLVRNKRFSFKLNLYIKVKKKIKMIL